MCSGRLFSPTGAVHRKTELGRDDDLVAERRECFSNKLFVYIGAINFGGIKERDAFLKGGPDDLDAFISVSRWPVVGASRLLKNSFASGDEAGVIAVVDEDVPDEPPGGA